MIRLHREVHEPRAETLPGSAKRIEDDGRKRFSPQIRKRLVQTQGDVDGMARIQRRAPEM